ncbi:MAG: O-antigen ligase family protein, partial [Flavobacteriaceae bacterium]|nr:O-antigen ligase family protein [Flavobacteriaceae bacterium]
IDMKASQWLSLSVINIIFLIFFLIKFRKINILKEINSNLFLKYFCFFFLAASISSLVALNKIESLVRLTDFFTILITIALSTFILNQNYLKINFLLILFTVSLILDLYGSLNEYIALIVNSDYNYNLANEIRSFYGNKNITAAAIAFKIPFVIQLFFNQHNYFLKFFLLIITTLAFYVLFLLTARAVFVSITVCGIFLVLASSIRYFLNNYKSNYLKPLVYIAPLILALTFFNLVEGNDESLKLQNRVNSIVSQGDESVAQRTRFYSHAIKQFSLKPFLGVGVGNWKIESIKFDSENIYSYVVPYFAHNDFLEVLAELGLIGFIPYLIFILLIFKINFQNLKDYLLKGKSFQYLLMVLPLIVYFIDMNLNFPLDRPAMQVFLITYIIILQINQRIENRVDTN